MTTETAHGTVQGNFYILVRIRLEAPRRILTMRSTHVVSGLSACLSHYLVGEVAFA